MDETYIGQYKIIALIGQGGMAQVYRALQPFTEREVALKVLNPGFLNSQEVQARFLREAQLLAKLEHSGIVPIYDSGLDANNQLYLAMRLMQGGALDELLKARGKLSIGEYLPMLQRVSAALDFAHRRKVVHRDLKPGNILFDEEGQAYLSDFGIAHVAQQTLQMTATGAKLGTPHYMAPEQFEGLAVDGRTDQYALAVMSYQVLSGMRPFEAETLVRLMKMHLMDAPPALTLPDAGLAGRLNRVLQRGMAKEPTERYATCGAFAQALAEANQPARDTRTQPSVPEATLLEATYIEPPPPTPAPAIPYKKRTRKVEHTAADGSGIEIGKPVNHPNHPVVAIENKFPANESQINQSIGDQNEYSLIGEVDYLAKPESTDTENLVTNKPRRIKWLYIWFGVLVVLGLILYVEAHYVHFLLPIRQYFNERQITARYSQAQITVNQMQADILNRGGKTRASDGMLMVYVPAGEFEMGSNTGDSDEQPVHTVYLDAYWIDQTEVTNGQYQRCVQAGQCEPSEYRNDRDFNGELQPVVGVDWFNARAYCEWAGAQLPSEAQWEKAARGTDGRTYPWGNAQPNSNLLNFYRNIGKTVAVGSYPAGASPYGALDLAGNVWEWVADWYAEGYYATSPARNPKGPSSGEYRVLRGGSWDGDPLSVRASFRYRSTPTISFNGIGFRCSAVPAVR
jgi:formylglycine-generating enzyme required for sulfatase activity/serine/threonine protein kinase